MERRNITLLIMGLALIICVTIFGYIREKKNDPSMSLTFKSLSKSFKINSANKIKLAGFSYDYYDSSKHFIILQEGDTYVIIDNKRIVIDVRSIYPSFNGKVTDFVAYTPQGSQLTQFFIFSSNGKVYNPYNYSINWRVLWPKLMNSANITAVDFNRNIPGFNKTETTNKSRFSSAFNKANLPFDFTFYKPNNDKEMQQYDYSGCVKGGQDINGRIQDPDKLCCQCNPVDSPPSTSSKFNISEYNSPIVAISSTTGTDGVVVKWIFTADGKVRAKNKITWDWTTLTTDVVINTVYDPAPTAMARRLPTQVAKGNNYKHIRTILLLGTIFTVALLVGYAGFTVFRLSVHKGIMSALVVCLVTLIVIQLVLKNIISNVESLTMMMVAVDHNVSVPIFVTMEKGITYIVDDTAHKFSLHHLFPKFEGDIRDFTKLSDSEIDYLIVTTSGVMYNYYFPPNPKLNGEKGIIFSWDEQGSLERLLYPDGDPTTTTNYLNAVTNINTYSDGNILVVLYSEGDWFEVPVTINVIDTDGHPTRMITFEDLENNRQIKRHLASKGESWREWGNAKEAFENHTLGNLISVSAHNWGLYMSSGTAYQFDEKPFKWVNEVRNAGKGKWANVDLDNANTEKDIQDAYTQTMNSSRNAPPNYTKFESYNDPAAHVLFNGDKMRYLQCAKKCTDDKKCGSFMYNELLKNCTTYINAHNENCVYDSNKSLFVKDEMLVSFKNKFCIQYLGDGDAKNKFLYIALPKPANPAVIFARDYTSVPRVGMTEKCMYLEPEDLKDCAKQKLAVGTMWQYSRDKDDKSLIGISSLNQGLPYVLAQTSGGLLSNLGKTPIGQWQINSVGQMTDGKNCYKWTNTRPFLTRDSKCTKGLWKTSSLPCGPIKDLKTCAPNTGGISSVELISGGTNYTKVPIVTFSKPPLVPPKTQGVRAEGIAILTDNVVTSIRVTKHGSGYSRSSPTVTIKAALGDAGTGALGTITLDPYTSTCVNGVIDGPDVPTCVGSTMKFFCNL